MDAIKIFIISIIFVPNVFFGQESIYPKDTIYVKFQENKGEKKWNTEYSLGSIFKGGKYVSNEESGIAFNLKDDNGQVMLFFYSKNQKADTLCIKHLKNYHISDLKEINEKRNNWIFDNKRPPADRNGVFQTYLIELISTEYIIIYPVIWRNEGALD